MQAYYPETDRLYLRQWCQHDLPAFAAMNADPHVMRYFPSLMNVEESNALAHRCETFIRHHGWGLWAVEEKSNKNFIGFVGLQPCNSELPFAPAVEVGWRLAYAHWGKGYATEAAKAALTIGFNELKLSVIVSFTSIKNYRSRAVMARLGLQDTGNNFLHPYVAVKSHLQEHCLYLISAEQWRKNQF